MAAEFEVRSPAFRRSEGRVNAELRTGAVSKILWPRFESRLDDPARLWTAAALCRFGKSSRVRKRQRAAAVQDADARFVDPNRPGDHRIFENALNDTNLKAERNWVLADGEALSKLRGSRGNEALTEFTIFDLRFTSPSTIHARGVNRIS